MANREDAQRGRAEARHRRRKETAHHATEDKPSSPTETSDAPMREQAMDEVKHAAKVAAASAAVGAAVAAARALATRDGEGGEQAIDEPEPQDKTGSGHRDEDTPEDMGESAVPSELATAEQPQPQGNEQRSKAEADEARREEKPIAGATPEAAKAIVRRAREQLESLLGREPESVSSLERIRDGWLVMLEVVEVSRIPESTDVLGSYEMDLDEDGNLRRYARVRRYRRSQADNGESS